VSTWKHFALKAFCLHLLSFNANCPLRQMKDETSRMSKPIGLYALYRIILYVTFTMEGNKVITNKVITNNSYSGSDIQILIFNSSFLMTPSIALTLCLQLRYSHYIIWKLLPSLKLINLTLEITNKHTAPLPTRRH
jgi:hypothetical protein